jgi:hypothetical protein
MDNMDVHNMKVEGDGEQDVRFFKHKAEAVLRELQKHKRRSHPRLARYCFYLFPNSKGTRGPRNSSNLHRPVYQRNFPQARDSHQTNIL